MSAADLPPLVSPEWLAGQLGAADLRVVDCGWHLPDEGRDGRAEFLEEHLPGAVHVDLSTELADADAAVRNTVATPDALARAFAAVGVGDSHRVVLYDRRGGYSAGRVWWTLRYVGHESAALLDGGLALWKAAGLATESGPVHAKPARFVARPRPSWLARKSDVQAALASGGTAIVDARGPIRFRGEAPEHTRRRGHIPGSVNVPYSENFCEEPARFLPRADLRAHYERAGVAFDRPVITTCGSGVTASLNAFALHLAGHEQVAVYDGSWAEWGNADDVEVETGDT